jgi:hypothetical protein
MIWAMQEKRRVALCLFQLVHHTSCVLHNAVVQQMLPGMIRLETPHIIGGVLKAMHQVTPSHQRGEMTGMRTANTARG